jgi:hypothetical protein
MRGIAKAGPVSVGFVVLGSDIFNDSHSVCRTYHIYPEKVDKTSLRNLVFIIFQTREWITTKENVPVRKLYYLLIRTSDLLAHNVG